jgi:hypothetical protein
MFGNDKNRFGIFFLGHFTSLAAALPKACLFSLSVGSNKELHFTKFIENSFLLALASGRDPHIHVTFGVQISV